MGNKKCYKSEYTEEQLAFIHKYGKSQLDSWKRMGDSLKKEYQEIENYYSIFANLLSEHYEDLKLYALMYRNVALYNCDKDPISVLFFASKQNEIIGFKKKLQADKNSDKAKIAFLFHNNMALFPKVVKKYTGINLKPFQPTSQVICRSLLNDFYIGNYNHIFSVFDLSDIDCQKILANKNNLRNDYLSLYNTCDEKNESLYSFANEEDFIKKYFIPNILKENTSFLNKRIDCYLKMKYSKKRKEEIMFLRKGYEEYIKQKISYTFEKNKQILQTQQEPEKVVLEYFSVYSFDIENLKRLKFSLEREIAHESNLAFNKKRYNIDPQKIAEEHKVLQDKCLNLKNRISEVESQIVKYEKLEREQYNKWLEQKRESENKQERLRKEEQERFKKEDERIDNLTRDAFDTLALRIKSTELFDFVRLNHDDMERYIITSCEKLYNILWLRNPEYMKKLEFRTTSANSIRNMFDSDSKKRKDARFFYYIKHKITGEEKIIFRERALMQHWCEIIDKEYEEAERIKEEKRRREEEQRRKEEEARREKFRYNERNRHIRDSRISFDESNHQYIVNGETLQSVTNFVDGCFPKFDAEFFAEKKANQLGISKQEVLDLWEQKGKESRDLGTILHKRIEGYFQDVTFEPSKDKAFELFKQFAEKATLKPYRTEWAIYDLKHHIAGTIDFVDYQNGEYIIYDWKRSEKLIDNGMPIKKDKYGKNGNYPLEHLDNSAYYHYALQLSLYKYILENNYGIKISDLRLGVFHPAYDKPYVLRMPYLEKEINDLFGLRSEILF